MSSLVCTLLRVPSYARSLTHLSALICVPLRVSSHICVFLARIVWREGMEREVFTVFTEGHDKTLRVEASIRCGFREGVQ